MVELVLWRWVEQKGMVPVSVARSLLGVGAGPDAVSTAAAGLIVRGLLARP